MSCHSLNNMHLPARMKVSQSYGHGKEMSVWSCNDTVLWPRKGDVTMTMYWHSLMATERRCQYDHVLTVLWPWKDVSTIMYRPGGNEFTQTWGKWGSTCLGLEEMRRTCTDLGEMRLTCTSLGEWGDMWGLCCVKCQCEVSALWRYPNLSQMRLVCINLGENEVGLYWPWES